MSEEVRQSLSQRVLERFSKSRDFTISFVLHAILVMILGTTVLFKVAREPADFVGESGGFVQGAENGQPPPSQQTALQSTSFNVTAPPAALNSAAAITTTMPSPLSFSVSPAAPAAIAPGASRPIAPLKPGGTSGPMTRAIATEISAFTAGWNKGGPSASALKNRDFEFTAYIGKYQGGNWDSTVRLVNNRIETGSLPNLLYTMSAWSKDKIKTNYQRVRAISLESNEIFSIKPPFIFFTGSRDFVLTDKEVQNLQRYVRTGGCIWGDSSLPGLRSRFDIAFRREMKRVIPDVDKDFEPLPADHPIFTSAYFPEIKQVPPGLNFYRLPVFAMKIYGEIAILYTANDYGDMWQIGVNKDGKIDERRNPKNDFIAINPKIWDNRGVYIHNIEPRSLVDTYKFGTNIVVHLLTRWESKVRSAGAQ